MTTYRRRRFIHGQIAWMLVSAFLLSLVGALSLELFFILSLIGLLVLTEVTAPRNVTPRWRRRLHVLVIIGLLAFMYHVVSRLVQIVAESGVF